MSEEEERQEFDQVMVRLLRQNLNAVFGRDIDSDECRDTFRQWTTTNWHMIVELAVILDTCLGPIQDNSPRQLTAAVVRCVEKKWVEHTS